MLESRFSHFQGCPLAIDLIFDRPVFVICTLLRAISRKLAFFACKKTRYLSSFPPLYCVLHVLFWRISDPQLSLYFPWSHYNYIIYIRYFYLDVVAAVITLILWLFFLEIAGLGVLLVYVHGVFI